MVRDLRTSFVMLLLPDLFLFELIIVVDLTSSREWAVKVDVSVPVHDFTDRVPNMAHKYPFELDTFQKRAVVHLENVN